jgi:undecaprenyl-diphosphatase
MSTFQSIILGMVQGIAEFLPISSSAHLVLVPWLFKWEDPGLSYDVFLHFGTLLALVIYFAKDWFYLIRAGILSIIERKIGYDRERLLFWMVVVATIPGALFGFLLHEQAESTFRSPPLIAMTLSLVGFFIYFVDGKFSAAKTIDSMQFKDAIWVGLAQALAIIPGVSRSGSTMATARLRGFSRESAARFSFLLAMPITFAACLFEAKGFIEQGTDVIFSAPLICGFLSSFLFGIFSIHFLLQWLKTTDFAIFAWYRIAVGAFVVIWSFLH